ncbi:MAG: hypothetical protein CVT48_03805 [Thermoplasmata archaeon HGW-Thermoplasmata-1]|nr:MAG: hypothetical protein CVT48_03805 [Thermoplasmata archaeon HGW-Thermoplasmata-1]
MDNTAAALRAICFSKVDEVANAILVVVRSNRRVFVYGAGRSGLVGKALAIRLVHLGVQTFVVGESVTPSVREGDLVILISGSGETIPVTMTAEIARRLGAKIVALTKRVDSHLARFSNYRVILAPNSGDGDKKQFAPLGTVFETAAWIFCDALVAELMSRLGETEENMRERHATLEH